MILIYSYSWSKSQSQILLPIFLRRYDFLNEIRVVQTVEKPWSAVVRIGNRSQYLNNFLHKTYARNFVKLKYTKYRLKYFINLPNIFGGMRQSDSPQRSKIYVISVQKYGQNYLTLTSQDISMIFTEKGAFNMEIIKIENLTNFFLRKPKRRPHPSLVQKEAYNYFIFTSPDIFIHYF